MNSLLCKTAFEVGLELISKVSFLGQCLKISQNCLLSSFNHETFVSSHQIDLVDGASLRMISYNIVSFWSYYKLLFNVLNVLWAQFLVLSEAYKISLFIYWDRCCQGRLFDGFLNMHVFCETCSLKNGNQMKSHFSVESSISVLR